MEINKLIEKRAVEFAPPGTPGYYSHMFLVSKGENKWRPIIDLSVLNTMLWIPSFHMETPESIRTAIQLNDWPMSIDLSDTFLHIPVNVQDRKYLRFAYKGESLQFGLATSPWLFTQIMIEVKIMALQKGMIIHQYLDDWLIRSQSKQVLLNQTEWLLALCKTLGLRINLEKSELTPTRDLIFVGYQYRTQINRVYPTQKRIEQIQQKATLFLNSQALPAREWLSLTGLLTATEKLVPMGRTHMRDLQYCLKRQWKQTETNFNQSVQIDHLARTELRWWYDATNLIVGAPMHPPNPDIQIFTDSSMEGWGAHTLNLEVSVNLEVSGVWSSKERTLHINNLELRAVVLALKHWERVVIGKTILVGSDNSTMVAYINKQGGTVSRSLCMETKEMLIWCHQREIILRARYIPGKLNALADQLSRRGQILHTEWSLCPRIFKHLCNQFTKPRWDLFATKYNKKLEIYASPMPDLESEAVDALSLSWENMWAYAYPSTALIPQILTKIQTEDCQIMLIAPAYARAQWYQTLLNLIVEAPVVLPPSKSLLKQPRSNIDHKNPKSLDLHAWILSRDQYKQRDFLKTQPDASQNQYEDPLMQYITASGESSRLGVVKGKLIRSKSLFTE